MNSSLVTAVILICLTLATWLGMRLQRSLPEQHFSADTKDTVKLAMGLVATMAALLLSLLVSSAKDSYDTVRDEIIQMAAKLTFLDRVLHIYGKEAEPIRKGFHSELETSIPAIWSHAHGDAKPDLQYGDGLYLTLQHLTPTNDIQRAMKDHAIDLTTGARTIAHPPAHSVRVLHLRPPLDGAGLLARDHLFQLQHFCSTQPDRHSRLVGLRSLSGWGHVFDPGDGSPLHGPHPNLVGTHGQCDEPNGEIKLPSIPLTSLNSENTKSKRPSRYPNHEDCILLPIDS
jgi:hypothetical protein